MQYLLDSDCDEDPKSFSTTDDNEFNVKLSLGSDDGSCFIWCHSKGLYELSVGYYYTKVCSSFLIDCKYCTQMINNPDYNGKKPKKCEYKKMKKYNKQTEILIKDCTDLSISNGQEIGYPFKIDIISLKKILFDPIECQKIDCNNNKTKICTTDGKENKVNLLLTTNEYGYEITCEIKKQYLLIVGYYDTRICKEECKYCNSNIKPKKKPKKCIYKQMKTYNYAEHNIDNKNCLYIGITKNLRPLMLDVIIFKKT